MNSCFSVTKYFKKEASLNWTAWATQLTLLESWQLVCPIEILQLVYMAMYYRWGTRKFAPIFYAFFYQGNSWCLKMNWAIYPIVIQFYVAIWQISGSCFVKVVLPGKITCKSMLTAFFTFYILQFAASLSSLQHVHCTTKQIKVTDS